MKPPIGADRRANRRPRAGDPPTCNHRIAPAAAALLGLVATLLPSAAVAAPPPAAPPPPATAPVAAPPLRAIRAGRLLDVRRGTLISPAVVLVQGDRIRSAGPAARVPLPAGTPVIDLGADATLLPGLIDAHAHLLHEYRWTEPEGREIVVEVGRSDTARRALRAVQFGRQLLEVGFTSVRDVGNSGRAGDVALDEAIRAGWVEGPRIQPCTRALAPVGGQFERLASAARALVEEEYVQVTGVVEARRAVRGAIFEGAGCIKVIVDSGGRTLAIDELRAIVEEAHASGRPVAAHAVTPLAVDRALAAGVDSIDHGYELSDAQLRLMARRRTFLVPTDFPIDMLDPGYLRKLGFAEGELRVLPAAVRQQRKKVADRLRRAARMGVRIAMGSDVYHRYAGRTRGEATREVLFAYLDAGLSPLAVIQSATLLAAELLGWQERVGVIEAGKLADLIAVAGDPLARPAALRRVFWVMKGGAVVRDGRPAGARDRLP